MDENEREALVRCVGPVELVDLVAYAEVRALIAAGLGVTVQPPVTLARTALVTMLRRPATMLGVPKRSIVDQLKDHVRASTAQSMRVRARAIAVERGIGAPLSSARSARSTASS